MPTVEELEKSVIEWAEGKGLIFEGNELAQADKFYEEAHEFYDEIYAGGGDAVLMEGGDVLVTLCIQAKLQNTTISEMLGLAFNKISKRKGKTINGTYVKEGDL